MVTLSVYSMKENPEIGIALAMAFGLEKTLVLQSMVMTQIQP